MKLEAALLGISMIFATCASAQQRKPGQEKMQKYVIEAQMEAAKPGGLERAVEICKKGLKKDSTFAELWESKGNFEYDLQDFRAALHSYKKVQDLEPDNYKVYFYIGICQRHLMMFDEAKASLNTYMQADLHRSKRNEQEARNILNNIETLKTLYNNPVEFKPQNLGPNVNTADGEYWPGMSLDEKYFYFTRMLPAGNRMTEDFFRCEIIDSTFGPAIRLPEPVNTPGREGTISVTADGRYIFFSSSERLDNRGFPMGQGGFDLYTAAYQAGKWSTPVNLGPTVNSPYWDSQPSISPDGLTIYFASARPGGYGGSDIWMSTFSNGRFTPPVNLGPEVNTPGEEQSPFIHYDNKTLYFSSNGHPGMGGIDIFVSKRQDDGKFGTPLNIGYPINSDQDELGLIVDRKGRFGYLSSERKGGYGGLDIYRFELPENLKPEPVSYVSGTVFDAATREKIESEIELTDLISGKVVAKVNSSKGTGEFFLVLQSNRNYMLTIDKMHYLFYSANFSLKEHSSLEPFKLEVPLEKPAANIEVVLNNVFFDVDKYELKPESKLELDKLVHLLKKFPFMKIEIGGHTDNTGDKTHNKNLSQNRAASVKAYLVSKGIEAFRLTATGYGDSKPVADNRTAEGRAQNRRTVFRVLSVE